MTLTKRQKEVLDFLVSFHNKHGYSPSFEEIARSLKLTSLATVHKHITTLERKGFVRRGYNQSRSIEVTQASEAGARAGARAAHRRAASDGPHRRRPSRSKLSKTTKRFHSVNSRARTKRSSCR